jgi:hypothetical protein
MLIGNPIYDVFFKYLLEDEELAKVLLSTIIGEEIIDLEPRPQETSINIPDKFLSVIRVDFKAIIKTPEGKHKKVLIELQKGKHSFDITRFRKYLGENYSKDDEIIISDESFKVPLPIITIYFLGFKLENITVPVVKAEHQYKDVINNKKLDVKDEFIEQLVHDCFVIQIPRLTENLQNKVERLLQIFNQRFISVDNNKILHFPEEWLKYEDLNAFTNRLGRSILSEQLIRQAEMEDEMERTYQNLSRKAEKLIKENIEQEIKLKEKESKLQEKETVIQEKETVIQEKELELEKLRELLKANNLL